METASRKSIENNKTYDVAIIGGGFSGLWSAYHLKQLQPALKIAVFEKEYVGFGASGRNGGWASAEYPTSSRRILKEHGEIIYRNLRTALTSSIDEIDEIAQSNDWSIDFAKGGALVFARNQAQVRRLAESIDDEHTYLTQHQAQELLNISNILGGVYTPHCAALNPFKLVRSLGDYLESIGVEIFENSSVESIKDGSISVNGFKVDCSLSVRATEAFTPSSWFAGKQIPIYSLMVATEPLDASVISELRNSQRATFAEACHLITYGQITADNRVAIGGRGVRYKLFSRLSERSEFDNRMHSALERRAKSWFPQLTDAKFEYRWGGAVALTRRWEPYLNLDLGAGRAEIGGYVGDGVTLSYLVAKRLAQRVCGENSLSLPFEHTKLRNWEPEPIRYLAVNAGFKATVAADYEERLTKRESAIASIVNPLIGR